MQNYNQQNVIHTLPTFKTEDISTDQTIRTKQSLLEIFASMVQISWFTSQFKFYRLKANVIHSHCYN